MSRAIVAVKSSAHFRSGYQEIAEKVIVTLAPGVNVEDPASFQFTKNNASNAGGTTTSATTPIRARATARVRRHARPRTRGVAVSAAHIVG